MRNSIILGSFIAFVIFGCSENALQIAGEMPSAKNNELSKTGKSSAEDKTYWYSGQAEITSYALTQARYGELHQGTAVFVFVTEPFSPTKFTKADAPNKENVSVLKLNQTRKFNTGIYPYSIMTSSFLPFQEGDHSIKITSSSQEWCGHTYMEVRNKSADFQIDIDSYFEDETVLAKNAPKAYLEDDIWTLIRIRDKLPMGNIKMYPSLLITRLMHIEYKAYSCTASLKKSGSNSVYVLHYPELDRTISIEFEQAHPRKIVGWTEEYYDGFGSDKKKLTTTATRMKSISSDYWTRNSVADSTYRKLLNL